MMKKIAILLILLFTFSCTPTPRKVNEAIGRGEITQAIDLFAKLLNEDGEISQKKFERLLRALAVSHKFKLHHADRLFQKLKPDVKPVILEWYSQQYLRFAEHKINEAEETLKRYRISNHQKNPKEPPAKYQNMLDNGLEYFKMSRLTWMRYQDIRKEHFPGLVEPTPVLGIIYLREAEFLIDVKQISLALKSFAQAKQHLSDKVPFDRVRQPAFKRLTDQVRQKLLKKR